MPNEPSPLPLSGHLPLGLSRWQERWLTGGLLVLAVVAVVLPFWPGVFTNDTFAHYMQATSGAYNDWHAPLLAWVWRLVHLAGLGPVTVLTAQVGAVVLGSWLVLRHWLRPAAAAALTFAVVVFPPVYGMLSWLGRDVWLAAAGVLCCGLLVEAGRHTGWRARSLVAAAVVVLWVYLAARQNGWPAALILSGAFAGHAVRRTAGLAAAGRWARAVAVVGLSVALCGGLAVAQRLHAEVIDVTAFYPEQGVYYFDLFEISRRTDTLLVPERFFPGVGNPDYRYAFPVITTSTLVMAGGVAWLAARRWPELADSLARHRPDPAVHATIAPS